MPDGEVAVSSGSSGWRGTLVTMTRGGRIESSMRRGRTTPDSSDKEASNYRPRLSRVHISRLSLNSPDESRFWREGSRSAASTQTEGFGGFLFLPSDSLLSSQHVPPVPLARGLINIHVKYGNKTPKSLKWT
ncbi:hypothetical protein F2P81_017484 [Scophthalmus maximus]|uniref:Uncharacterized protein n=1 Tax=Scophthalmus maximus TaxID=52904 RepID=A0A6A4S8Z1_SCOMX|nr:hypothetical protein F2P81_017484 [Scophthalmus maximus]